MKKLCNNRGFSMIEVILALVIGAMTVGITTESMINNVDSYVFLANRKAALGDVRYAMNRISQELLTVNTGNITTTNGTKVIFVNDSATNVEFKLAANGSKLGVFRNADLLVDNVSSFTFIYYDANGTQLDPLSAATPAATRRIKFTITTQALDNEGNITLSTIVTPRDFIGYNNYQ